MWRLHYLVNIKTNGRNFSQIFPRELQPIYMVDVATDCPCVCLSWTNIAAPRRASLKRHRLLKCTRKVRLANKGVYNTHTHLPDAFHEKRHSRFPAPPTRPHTACTKRKSYQVIRRLSIIRNFMTRMLWPQHLLVLWWIKWCSTAEKRVW